MFSSWAGHSLLCCELIVVILILHIAYLDLGNSRVRLKSFLYCIYPTICR